MLPYRVTPDIPGDDIKKDRSRDRVGECKARSSLGVITCLKPGRGRSEYGGCGGGGSIFGSLIALGYGVEEIVEMNQRLWTHEVTRQPNCLVMLQMLLPKFFKTGEYFYMHDDHLMNDRLHEAFGEKVSEIIRVGEADGEKIMSRLKHMLEMRQ